LTFSSVAKSDDKITIRYYFVPHKSKGSISSSLGMYFALIPLENLPAGNYSVDIVRTTELKYTGRNFQPVGKEIGEKRVCKSFVFTVVDKREDANVTK